MTEQSSATTTYADMCCAVRFYNKFVLLCNIENKHLTLSIWNYSTRRQSRKDISAWLEKSYSTDLKIN